MSIADSHSPRVRAITGIFIQWQGYDGNDNEIEFACIEDAVAWLQYHDLTNKTLKDKREG